MSQWPKEGSGHPKPLVLYHAGCADGFSAAWVVHQLGIDAEFRPVDYEHGPPDATGRDVMIFDFAYPREALLAMKERAASLVVLDHHKTHAEVLSDLPFCRFDMEKSGGQMAWEYFKKDEPPPWLVAYTEDRDLWRWALPHSREVNAALRSYPRKLDVWDALAKRDVLELAAEGKAIARYEDQLVRALVRLAREIEFDGHKVLAVNTSALLSEVAGKLAEGRPFGIAWFTRADGKRSVALRSREGGIDVSEIAKRHGGGGHRNASGFIAEAKGFDY